MGDLLNGELSIIGMKGCEDFTNQVDAYLREWRCRDGEDRTLLYAPNVRVSGPVKVRDLFMKRCVVEMFI